MGNTAASAKVTEINIRLELFKKSVFDVKRASAFGKGDAAEKALDDAVGLFADIVEVINLQVRG
jgi:hypothetical protein